MTYNELVRKIVDGGEGFLNLEFEDAAVLANILLKKGYAILLTSGDIGDEVRIEWKYAGEVGNLKYAHRGNVAFGEPSYIEDIANGNYEPYESEGDEE